MARTRDRDDDRRGRSGGYGGYQKRDPSSVKKRAEQQGGNFDSYFKEGVKVFQAESGETTIRFLPPTWEGADHYGHDIYVHYGIGADKGSYLCLKKMKGKHCPICEAAKEMKAEGETDAAKRIEAKKRVLVYLIDRSERRPELEVWAMPWTLDKDIAGVSQNRKTGEIMAIDHEVDGYDVIFRKEGKARNTRYSGVAIDREPSPLSESKKEMREWLDEAAERPLPKLLKYYDEAHLQEVVDGHTASSDDDDDDDKPKKKGRSRDDDDDDDDRPSKKRRSRDDDDDDDDDRSSKSKRRSRDDDDDDDDDRSAKKRRPADDDDDEDDDSSSRKKKRPADDDDDDDDAPSRKKRKRDDDEDEADPADDDDDEDDRPRGKSKSRKSSDDDDEDDDDKPRRRSRSADDDDDDDDAPPRRRR